MDHCTENHGTRPTTKQIVPAALIGYFMEANPRSVPNLLQTVLYSQRMYPKWLVTRNQVPGFAFVCVFA